MSEDERIINRWFFDVCVFKALESFRNGDYTVFAKITNVVESKWREPRVCLHRRAHVSFSAELKTQTPSEVCESASFYNDKLLSEINLVLWNTDLTLVKKGTHENLKELYKFDTVKVNVLY